MTREEQLEADLKQTQALLAQEKGKVIALERQNYEIKRAAQQTEDQAKALQTETQASLSEAAEQMKVALGVSQGVWALAHMGRSFLARKVAAGRIVHREAQFCILLEQMMDAIGKDPNQLRPVMERAKNIIETIKRDGEATRVAAAEAALSYGVQEFQKHFDQLLRLDNTL